MCMMDCRVGDIGQNLIFMCMMDCRVGDIGQNLIFMCMMDRREGCPAKAINHASWHWEVARVFPFLWAHPPS